MARLSGRRQTRCCIYGLGAVLQPRRRGGIEAEHGSQENKRQRGQNQQPSEAKPCCAWLDAPSTGTKTSAVCLRELRRKREREAQAGSRPF